MKVFGAIMSDSSSTERYAPFRSGRERFALALVLLVVLGIPAAVLGYRAIQAASPVRVIELTGRLPTAEQGGWTPETIRIKQGERVRLRLTSTDVVHGFAIPKLGVDAGWIEPGKVKEIEFTADRPGRYTYQCTVWCQDGHWRMRGIVEVIDPANPASAEIDVDPPQTDWVASGIDLDADHPGANVPSQAPDAANGARLWQQIGGRPAAEMAARLDLRRSSPSNVYARLTPSGLSESKGPGGLTSAERWDVVAYLWREATTTEALQRGAELYRRDCTGCHGPAGQGDGPGAVALKQHSAMEGRGEMGEMEAMAGMNKPPTDFTNLAAQAGASDLLYYGKLVRGGMGTSMPYWGTIYTEEELWAVVAYLRSLAFSNLK